ncbi:MAG: hypothetical protein SVQ76_01185 [Candidatus Nanohaloarchaea archaeon]|nr:hypothetical protein [Candidatus Nanohaloarchaea archaeon]
MRKGIALKQVVWILVAFTALGFVAMIFLQFTGSLGWVSPGGKVPSGPGEDKWEKTGDGTGAGDGTGPGTDVSPAGVLKNPGFEGSGGWSCFTRGEYEPDSCTASYSKDSNSGSASGYVSNNKGACGVHGLHQSVTVPQDKSTLTFWMRVELPDPGWDWSNWGQAGIYVYSGGSRVAEKIFKGEGAKNGKSIDWAKYSVDLSNWKGKEVEIVAGNGDTSEEHCHKKDHRYKVWVDDFAFR